MKKQLQKKMLRCSEILIIAMLLFTEKNCYSQWSVLSSGVTTSFEAVYFTSKDTGFAAGSSIIRKTVNGGTSWTTVYNGTTGTTLHGLFFTDSNNGYAVGSGGIILTTNNGGSFWSSQIIGTASDLRAIYFVDANTGWVVGDGGKILKTANAGGTWIPQSSSAVGSLRSVNFLNQDTGFAISNNGFQVAEIISTVNGGSSWTQKTNATITTCAGHFVSSTKGFVAGGWGGGGFTTIQNTLDAGNTWTNVQSTSNCTSELDAITFVNSTLAFAVGDAGTILKSIDGGDNWTVETAVTTKNLHCINFPTGTVGYAAGESGTILKYSGSSSIEISESFQLNLSTYPNPVKENVTLSVNSSSAEKGIIKIYDVLGNEVEKENIQLAEGKNNTTLSLSGLNSGIYLIEVYTGTKKLGMQKITKE